MLKRSLTASTILVCLAAAAPAQTAADVAPDASAGSRVRTNVVIGVPDWASARATANIVKVVLEQNLAVAVEPKAMSNEDIFAGMDAGTVHAHPEVWAPNLAHDDLVRSWVEEAKR